MCAKRKGSLLLDALLGMMILLVGIIPLISSITFAYGADFRGAFDLMSLDATNPLDKYIFLKPDGASHRAFLREYERNLSHRHRPQNHLRR